MQGIYTYIPETNNVHSEHTVAAILLLLFMVPILLLLLLLLLQVSFHSVAVVLTLVTNKNKYTYRNNAKTHYKQYNTQSIQVYMLQKQPHITKQVKTTTVQDTHQMK
jgi:hypothetical protein